jgi:serine/threonine protein phosphatase PrpC
MYVLADAFNAANADQVTGQMLNSIDSEFKRSGPSITTALTSALNATNSLMLKLNAGLEEEKAPKAGVTCAVLTRSELYVAQAGPSLAYLYSGERIKKWMSSSVPSAYSREEAIGSAPNIHVNLQRHDMREGDVLLLASPSLGGMISNDELAIILTAEPDQAIQRVYLIAKKEENFSAMLVAMLP